jgi:hypothetical protein
MRKGMLVSLLLSIIVIISISCEKQVDYMPQINALQRSRDSLVNALAQTNAILENTNSNVASINKSLDSVRTQLTGISAQITLLNSQMTAANANIASINSQLSFLTQQYADLLARFNSLLALVYQYPPYSLYADLVSYYPFSGNAKDKGGSGLDGTLYGPVLTYDRFGYINSAYSFDNNQYIDVVGSASKNLYPMTINLWASFDSLNNGDGSLFKKYSPTLWNGFALLPSVGNNINTGFVYPFYLTGQTIPNGLIGGYGLPTSTFTIGNISTSKWVQITMTVDSTVGKLFLNGNLVDSLNWRTSAKACSNNLTWIIGGSYQNNNWFKGKIDDVGVWQRALTVGEIRYLYTNQFIQ